jgi:hypothetical protein
MCNVEQRLNDVDGQRVGCEVEYESLAIMSELRSVHYLKVTREKTRREEGLRLTVECTTYKTIARLGNPVLNDTVYIH